MIVRIVFLAFFACGVIAGEAQAQLYLENGKVVLAVSGGEHTNGSLIIRNTSADQADVKVYWEDFKYKPPYDGSKDFLPASTVTGSASQWVTFYPQSFSLPPFGQQKIDYSVAVPGSIDKGHYGVLFFEKSSLAVTNGEGVNLVTRVGCLFFIEPTDKNKNAAIENVKLEGNESFSASFANHGNIIIIPRTTYYIMQEGGLVLLRGEANKVYVPPGAAATIEIPLKKKLSPGRYTLVVNADLQEGDVAVKEISLAVDASGQITIVNS